MGDRRYTFHAFTQSDPCHPPITWTEVAASDHRKNPMVEALRARCIDVALLWPLCPETYSFTMQEAAGADAFVVTNTISGNIAATVCQTQSGIALENEASLIDLFRNGAILDHVQRYRTRRTHQALAGYSAMTADLLQERISYTN